VASLDSCGRALLGGKLVSVQHAVATPATAAAAAATAPATVALLRN